MPKFTSLADADAWRAVHAPARKTVETSPKKGAEVAQKNARDVGTTTGNPETQLGATADGEKKFGGKRDADGEPWPPLPERIDVEGFIDRLTDFDALMIRQAEEAPQIAFGLLKRKMTAGEPGAISAATKNWHEATKAAADVREKFVALQRETRALVHIDEIENIIGPDLQEIRRGFVKLGERVGPVANPAAPALAQKAIDDAVDAVFAQFADLLDRVKGELRAAAS